jgi:hypothetical protein
VLGGETTSVQSFIAESGPEGKRASWTTLVTSFVYWPVAILGLLIFGLRRVMPLSTAGAGESRS